VRVWTNVEESTKGKAEAGGLADLKVVSRRRKGGGFWTGMWEGLAGKRNDGRWEGVITGVGGRSGGKRRGVQKENAQGGRGARDFFKDGGPQGNWFEGREWY